MSPTRPIQPGARTRSELPEGHGREDALRRIDRLSYLLDNSIKVPGVNYRVGWDALIGLVPGVGDAVGLVLSSYIVVEAARIGAPRSLLVRMAGNVAVEALVGAIPLLGDLFDATWKANARNMHLLRSHLGVNRPGEAPRRGIGWLTLGGIILVLVGLIGGLIYLVALALGALF